MVIACAKFGDESFCFGRVPVEFLALARVCFLRSVPVRNSQVQLAGAGAFTGQNLCVLVQTRACSLPLFAVRRGSVQSSPKLTRLWLAVLSFQAPIGAHPEPVHAQHQEQEQQFTLIGFSAAVGFC